ncbi:MAG: hypothetical protein JSS87_06455 [Acidobacteria bacterium]|nr:hypothetical protein [Acidobacteriota bacterium]
MRVKHAQGAAHGFLIVRSESGAFLASGDVIQTTRGSIVTSRLTYNFHDGSVDEETTTYSQHGVFRLVRDHHIQRGPSFPKPIDVTIDAKSGIVTSRSTDKEGKQKVETEHFDLPPDTSNGFIGTELLNIPPNTKPFKISMLAPSGKGRLVKLEISPAGKGTFRIAGHTRHANIFRIKIELGGLTGVVASIAGKKPEDQFVWVLGGEVPMVIRQIGQMYAEGPIVHIALAGASFGK